MNWKKKLLALGLSLALTLSLTACGQKTSEPEQPEEPAQTEEPAVEAPDGTEADTAHFRIAALKGPTAMGLVKLMKDNDETIGALLSSAKPYEGEVGNLYTFTLAGSADEVTPALIKGDLDRRRGGGAGRQHPGCAVYRGKRGNGAVYGGLKGPDHRGRR